jgi:hypothetical protein
VVGHRDRVEAHVDCLEGVVEPHDALEHQGARVVAAEPGEVVPGRQRSAHPLRVGTEEGGRRLAGQLHVGRREVGQGSAPGPLSRPPGTTQDLRREPHHGAKVQVLGDVGAPPVAALGERPVQRHDDAGSARGPRPLDPRQDLVTGAGPVELEEGLRVDGHDLLDRLAAERGQPDRRASRSGRASDRELTVGVHRLHAGGRDHHRKVQVQAHHRGREIALGREVRHVRGEPQLAVGVDVVLEGLSPLGAGDQRHVDRGRQGLLRPPLGLGDGLEPGVPHQAGRPVSDIPVRGSSSQARSGLRIEICTGTGPPRTPPRWEWSSEGAGLVTTAASAASP